jgi:S1-C subfamily serine protease
MNEEGSSRTEIWRARMRKLRTGVKHAMPFAGGVLAALLAIFLYNAISPGPHQLTSGEVKDLVSKTMASATPGPANSAIVYSIIQPSLVLIQTGGSDDQGKPQHGLGSGVIINTNGDILTCLHVVAGAGEIKVLFADGTQASAQVTVKQPENDIAVLRADQLPAQVVPATLGNPRSMNVGDEAYAVGNPFGLYGSMTAGVISGFDRSFQPPHTDQELKGLIQIDSAVNPGNSGGPLLNRDGEVIGIVEGIVNPTGQDVFIGIGFAVPINIAGSAFGLPPD